MEPRLTTLTEDLADLLARPITPADRRRAALHLLDWIGCATAGAASEVGQLFRRYVAKQPSGTARVLLGGAHGVRDAAFANGAFGNVLEMDDVHRASILHPGPVVVPAALAMASALKAPSTALLDAILRGYEAEIRIGRAMGPAHYRQFHPTSTCGPFGAAAAAASLLGLDRAALVAALGNAGTQAGGVWQCRIEPVMTKQLHTARATVMGLEAAMLAAEGLTGPRAILEGPLGIFAGLAPDAAPARVLAEPDAPWLVHETSFKPWPACRHCHPAIDAALPLRGQGNAPITEILVHAYADAIAFCDRPVPRTTNEAKFSLQHAVAVALLDGPPSLAAFDPPALARADVAALRARVRLVGDPGFTAAYPGRFGAAVTMIRADGSVRRIDVPDALGDPENPLPLPALVAKAQALMASAGVEAARSQAVIAATLGLAEGAPLGLLTAALP